MSVEDPFASLVENESSPKDKVVKQEEKSTVGNKEEKKAVEDALKFDGASYFAAEMVIAEEDYVLPQSTFSGPYVKPKVNSYIPVRISSGTVEERTQKRLVVGISKDGTERATSPERIEELVEEGGTQVIEENVPYFQFKMEAEHVSGLYGSRFSPYWLFVSAFDQMIPLSEAKRSKDKVGWPKTAGRKLLTATRVGIEWRQSNPDRPIREDATLELLQEVADSMVGKIVMARVWHSDAQKKVEFKPRVGDDGSFVKAKIDHSLGEFVKLTKNEDGSYVDSNSGEIYGGDITGLIKYENEFLVPDSSDDGEVVQDRIERETVYDKLQENVFPIPHEVVPEVSEAMKNHFTVIERGDGKQIVQRLVVVNRNDGSKTPAEVTWETVGQIATQKRDVGTAVQAVTIDNEIITATWLGTHWQETPQPHRVELSELGEVRLVAEGPVEAGIDFSGLDEFKG